MKFTYLLINLAIIIIPLILSFEKKIRFISHWKALLPAILITAVIFIIWDIIFTYLGVWSFNKDYILGINIVNLPIEEILFFITVPYSCLFIFVVVDYYLPDNKSYQWINYIYYALVPILIIIGLLNHTRLYTVVTFLGLSFVIFLSLQIFKFKKLKTFTLSFILSIIPFLIFNGLLTSIPVVLYNGSENLGVRLLTIPIEDIFYGMLLILINTLIYNKKIS
jgi:lycopene cyclase domain-containing protein